MKLDVEKIKNFVYGLMVIVSLIGAMYGSFKPESDARESHNVLAPVVDQAADALQDQNERLIALEAKNEVYQALFVGVFAQSVDSEVLSEMIMYDNVGENELEVDPEATEVRKPKPKKKQKALPPPVQQRQKAHWEKK